MRPPIPYFGGKQMLANRIVDQFPAHSHYVEPFAGSLAVLLAKPQSKMETVNDLDGELVNFWRVLRDRTNDLLQVCSLTPHSRAEHAGAYDLDHGDEVERARRVWVQLTQGRGGTRRRTGWRNYEDPTGSTVSMPGYLRGYIDRMPPTATRLLDVSLECRPAVEMIRAYGEHDDVLIYADPPYLGSTRTSRQYVVEMSHRDEHEELAKALADCRAAVVLSGYSSPLYEDLYAGWHRVELDAFTGQAGNSGNRTEVLWINRMPEGQLDFDVEEATA